MDSLNMDSLNDGYPSIRLVRRLHLIINMRTEMDLDSQLGNALGDMNMFSMILDTEINNFYCLDSIVDEQWTQQ